MRISTNFLLLLFIGIFFSCKKDNASIDLLRQAQNIVEDEPQKALVLLDSIPNPQDMGEDNYMQYIVADIQARQRTKQDITNDTLIFRAQRYFDQKDNPEQAALANYYAGRIYRSKNIPDKALKCFLQSEANAIKYNKNVLVGKNLHFMGNLYFEQGIMDTAIILYKKALIYYNEEEYEDTDKFQLQVINEMGRAYDEIGNIDSSFVYFQKAMDLADRLGDQKFKTVLFNNLGYTYFLMKDYSKASEYLNNAFQLLPMTDAINRCKTDINLSYLYISTNQSDSAKYYIELSEKELTKVEDDITLKYLYSSLIVFFKQTEDYKQVAYYTDLRDSVQKVIAKSQRPLSLMAADKSFSLEQQQKEYDYGNNKHIYHFLLMGAVVFAGLLLFGIGIYRVNKQNREAINREKEKYRKIKELLLAEAAEYEAIEAEIAAMLKDETEGETS